MTSPFGGAGTHGHHGGARAAVSGDRASRTASSAAVVR